MIAVRWLDFLAFYVATVVALRLLANATKNTQFGPAIAFIS